jgi:hypothetical protein
MDSLFGACSEHACKVVCMETGWMHHATAHKDECGGTTGDVKMRLTQARLMQPHQFLIMGMPLSGLTIQSIGTVC